MRYVLEDIDSETLPGEMKRRGIPPRQKLRVIVETLDDMPLARMADEGGAFAFLADEPDIYREADIKHPNV